MNVPDNIQEDAGKLDPRGYEEADNFSLINERDIFNWTPVHYAAVGGNIRFLRLLQNSRASIDPTLKDHRGYTALHCAIERGTSRVIDALIDLGFKVDARGFDGATPIHLAAGRGNTEALDFIFDFNTDWPLFESKHEQENAAKKLEDANGRMPLHCAVMGGHTESLTKLHEDINAADKAGRTSLHMAVLNDKPDVIQKLCDLSVDKNKRDHQWRAALLSACRERKMEAIQILLKAGASTEVPLDDGRRPLHVATIQKDIEIMIELLKAGADANTQDNSRVTPLHEAVWSPSPEIINLLLENGANPNLKDATGKTPIHRMLVVNYSQEPWILDSIRVLADGGANRFFEDDQGARPIDVARKRNHSIVVECLESLMEKWGMSCSLAEERARDSGELSK